MAKKTAEYHVQGKVSKISATSRCAIKVRDNYYTIEATEERVFPNDAELDMDIEYSHLFDSVNTVVDNQMNEILETFGRK